METRPKAVDIEIVTVLTGFGNSDIRWQYHFPKFPTSPQSLDFRHGFLGVVDATMSRLPTVVRAWVCGYIED